MSYNILNRDCWGEIFSWLPFDQRHRIRRVCRKWNELILSFKKFWPLDPNVYRPLAQNLCDGKFKHTRYKFSHNFTRTLVNPYLGLVLADHDMEKDEYTSFWIYSEQKCQLLHHHDTSFLHMQSSKNHILLHCIDGIWLFSFQRLLGEKESLVLDRDYKLFENNNSLEYIFQYPYVCCFDPIFTFEKSKRVMTPKLFDLNTGLDLFKENNINFNNEYCTLQIVSNNAIVHFTQNNELWILDLNNLKTPYLKIPLLSFFTIEKEYLFLENCIHYEWELEFLESPVANTCDKLEYYHIPSKKKHIIELASPLAVRSIDSTFVIVRLGEDKSDFYLWNLDYTNITHFKTSKQDTDHIHVRYFDLCLSFFFVKIKDKVLIYSKANRKLLATLDIPKNYKYISTDEISKLYYQTNTNELSILDFSF